MASGCSGAEEDSAPGLESDPTIDSTAPSVGAGEDGDGSDPDAGSADPEPDEQNDGDDNSGGQDDNSGGPDPITPSISDEELTERLADLGGRLAIGDGPAIAVARPDGARLDVLDGSESVVAGQPTWSHDGERLAWSSISPDRQLVQVQNFGDDGEPSGEPERANAEGPPAFYLQWTEDDQRLAYLRNAPGGSEVEVGVVDPGLPIEPLGRGAPFYISWSPGPDRLLGHVGSSSIDRYDPEADGDPGFVPVLPVSGGFSAPAWVDDQRALIVADDQLAYLDVERGGVEPIVDLGGPVRFVLSPDRTKVAYQVTGGEPGPSLITLDGSTSTIQNGRPGLVVLDLATLDQQVVTTELAAAWEWSPDSGLLAWLGVEVENRRPVGRWNFWSDGAGPPTERSPEFVITRKYGQVYLPFFAQYTQSVTGWSPDSSAFALAGTIDGEGGVWIQLVTETVEPRRVASGDFVTWGPGRPPPPDGSPSAA